MQSKHGAPVYLHNMFAYATSITGHVGRNAHRLFVPQINTDYGKRSLYHRRATIWNALPTALSVMSLHLINLSVIILFIYLFIAIGSKVRRKTKLNLWQSNTKNCAY